MKQLLRAVAIMVVLCLGFRTGAVEVNVFAAASLTDALKQIAADYEKSSGDKIIFNFAASGTLALQIENGAPADIFLSADEVRMDALEKKGLVATETRRDLLGNALVMVIPPENTAVHSPYDLTNAAVGRIAIGETKTVPAGAYTRIYLEKLGLWPDLQAKIIPCENVRAVLAAVESGNVDAGFVYKTDAAISKKVKTAFEVPVADGPKISYPVALVKGATQPAAAKNFLAYLESQPASAIFAKAGFDVIASH